MVQADPVTAPARSNEVSLFTRYVYCLEMYIKTRVLFWGALKVLAQVQVGHTWRISNVCTTKIFGAKFKNKKNVYRTNRSAYLFSLIFHHSFCVWKKNETKWWRYNWSNATRLLYNTAHRTFDWDGFTWSGVMCIDTDDPSKFVATSFNSLVSLWIIAR